MSWVPTTDFEEEIVDLQPDHDFIYGHLSEPTAQTFYPRPKEHLAFVEQQKKEKNIREKTLTSSQNHKLNLIAKVQRIAGTKPLGEQPTIEDWDSNENVVQETIALMRHIGFNPCVEEALDEDRTIATHPITEEIKINRNGRKKMPIFLSEKFFELKPRNISPSTSPSFTTFQGADIDEVAGGLNQSVLSQRSSITSDESKQLSQASSSGSKSKCSDSDIITEHTSISAKKSRKKIPQQASWVKSSQSNINISRSSVSDSSNAKSSYSYKDRSLNSSTSNSGFDSAIGEIGDADSYETAKNSLNESRKKTCPKNKSTTDVEKWRNVNQVIKTQSWKKSFSQNNGNESQHVQSNWRSPRTGCRLKNLNDQQRNTAQFCTPKELYEKKRSQSTHK